MSLNNREKKLLLVLVVISIVFLVAYLIIPKIDSISELENKISEQTQKLEQFQDIRTALNLQYDQNQMEIERLYSTIENSEKELEEVKFYNEISNAEIVVEINKFIPISESDKFIISNIQFIEPIDETENDIAEISLRDDNVQEESSLAEENSKSDEIEENDGTEENDDVALDKIDTILTSYGFEENQTSLGFLGYYSSLIKFLENLNNNENFVVAIGLNIENVALNDPTFDDNMISGEMILAFPTYSGSSENTDIFAILENVYDQSTSDPFDPFDSFVTLEELENMVNGTLEEEEDKFKVIDNFNNSDYFFVTNDSRNGGYVSSSQQSTDGNKSLKLYYDFYNRNNKNIAYVVNDNESAVLTETPMNILIDVFNDSANENSFGIVFRDATGNQSEILIVDKLDFNGWSTCTIPLPENMVYPVNMQRFFVQSNGSGIKQEGTILLDNLRILEYENE